MKQFRNRHQGKSMLVCGLGPSLLDVPRNPPIASIGVNDCWARVETDYLLVVGTPEDHFTPERRRVISDSKPKAWFLDQEAKEAWKAYWGTNGYENVFVPHFSIPEEKPRKGKIYSVPETSPATAIGIALFMGATRIGLVGVDLYDHPNHKDKIEEMNVKSQAPLRERMRAMYGMDGQERDRLTSYSNPASGAFYFAPSVETLDKALS